MAGIRGWQSPGPRRWRAPGPGRRALITALAALSLAVTAGCGSGPPDRGQVLGRLADTTIVPGYETLAGETAELAATARALCADPSMEAIADTRAALAGARAAWLSTEALWVGPVTERRSWAVIDWPIAPDEIEALIDDPAFELTVDDLGTRIGADQRGLGAVEHVVAGGGDPAATLASLTDERRCDYLVGVAAVIAEEAALLPDDWTGDFEGGGPYRDTFTDPGGDDLDAMVNDIVFLLEAMTDAELGRALGEMTGPADPEALREGGAGLGVADLLARLEGIRAALVGSGPAGSGAEGIGPLLGDELWSRLGDEIDQAEAAVAVIDGPLRQAVVDDPAGVGRARDAIKVVQVTVATEVVSRLGVTIGFSDADGDTGA